MDQILLTCDPKHIEPQNPLQDYHEAPAPLPDITTPLYKRLAPLAAEMLARGSSYRGAAAKLDLSYTTIAWWDKTAHFAHLIDLEKEKLREELLGNIRQAGKKEHLWTANAWYLERNKAFAGEFDPPAVRAKVEIDLTARVFTHLQVEDLVQVLEVTKCLSETE